jgi:hypothetical protein
VIDVRTPSNLLVGYVMGVGDQVPRSSSSARGAADHREISPGATSRASTPSSPACARTGGTPVAPFAAACSCVFHGGTMIVQ